VANIHIWKRQIDPDGRDLVLVQYDASLLPGVYTDAAFTGGRGDAEWCGFSGCARHYLSKRPNDTLLSSVTTRRCSAGPWKCGDGVWLTRAQVVVLKLEN